MFLCLLGTSGLSLQAKSTGVPQRRQLLNADWQFCLNDSDYDFDFEKHRSAWLGALDSIMPDPSSFEKDPVS